MITLRPYQTAAISAITRACVDDRYLLLQAGTGAGKTILFSSLIKQFMTNYQMRIAVVAHREILVRQAYEKLCKVWPEAALEVGLACASVTNDINTSKPVIIGSPQTLANRLNTMPPVHLLIIDECHRVPPRNDKSQYRTLIERMESYYPELRVLGVTATPFRMGHGYIYGDRCKPGKKNWWNTLHYQISISTLQNQGFLVPYRAKEAEDISSELTGISTSNGEYNTRQLSDVMSREVHVGSAVRAYEEYARDRRHVAIFCVTIDHAEKVKIAFENAGYATGIVHSQMPKRDRNATLNDFDAGRLRVICNVGVLTEGWDATAVDCILLCRPTMSPALYVQIIGRGLRINPGKTDCLILDFSGNCRRHGDPDDPQVKYSKAKKDDDIDVERMKTCPECKNLVPRSIYECSECGYLFDRPDVVEINDSVDMKNVSWAPFEVAVSDWHAESFVSRKGNRMLKITLTGYNGGAIPLHVSHFLDIEGQGSAWGQQKAAMLWRLLDPSTSLIPRTVDDAAARFCELRMPTTIVVKQNGSYLNVVRW